MDEFPKYQQMLREHAAPDAVYHRAKADGLQTPALIRLLRFLFGLSLGQAKEVMLRADGIAASLDEYQGRLATGLHLALDAPLTVDACQRRFGLRASRNDLPEIRDLLAVLTESKRRRQGAGDTELMKLLCVQLFGAGLVEDALPIWQAKSSSFDAHFSIDVQLLCGAGLPETKSFLGISSVPAATQALQLISHCEDSGDFIGFSPESALRGYLEYYDGPGH